MSITASAVKELREKTGAGMMDCKKALEENAGDMEKAIDWLRQKGLSKAAKKAGRATSEGLVGCRAAVEKSGQSRFPLRGRQLLYSPEQSVVDICGCLCIGAYGYREQRCQ